MRKIVFDIETRNIFDDVGKADPALLDISIVGVYDYETDSYSSYLVEELPKLWPLIEQTELLIGYNSDITKIKSLDILAEVRKSLGRRVGLGNIAEATLGYGKNGHGLQAIEWWKKGDIERSEERRG